jgi:hypothetical protein
MKTTTITTLILFVLLALVASPTNIASAEDEEEIVLSEVHDFQGEQVHAISRKEANAMAAWSPATQDPRLSIVKAIKAAKEWLKAKGYNEDAALGDIALKTPHARGLEDRWFYVFMYYTPPEKGSDYPRAVRVVVLMNGKVVDRKGK